MGHEFSQATLEELHALPLSFFAPERAEIKALEQDFESRTRHFERPRHQSFSDLLRQAEQKRRSSLPSFK